MTFKLEDKPGAGSEFASLGARLVRFGQALQEPSTRVSELVALAQACGINFKLRVVADNEDGRDE
ncbi:hypothetical protein [Pseudomonas sp. MRSN 12121]|uniref:hypothetical protein n=1 Tax=Pseudomonas sp. MRSN 12121 TaxID=1611770 RepID=UPI0005C9EDBC|nr:hypothetical protein [Pseudomonas sp. MRSN 12121]